MAASRAHADGKDTAAAGAGGATNGLSTDSNDPLAPVEEMINQLSTRLARLQSLSGPTGGLTAYNSLNAIMNEFQAIAQLLSESSADPLLHDSERKRYAELLKPVRGILTAHRAATIHVTGSPPPPLPPLAASGAVPATPARGAAANGASNGNGAANGNGTHVIEMHGVVAGASPKAGKPLDAAKAAAAAADHLDIDADGDKLAPVEQASWFGFITYGWMNDIITRGYRTRLEEADIPPVPTSDRTTNVSRKWKETWANLSAGRAQDDPENPATVIRTVRDAFGAGVYQSAILEVFWMGVSFANPYVVKALITYIVTGGQLSLGIGLAIALAVVNETNSLLINSKFYLLTRVGSVARAAIINAIYEKALRLSSSAKQSSTMGETVNLMSNDSQRIYEAFPFMNTIWTSPITIAVCIVLLWQEINVAALASVALMFCLIPLQILLGKKIGELRRVMTKHTDERVKFMSEILQGIRVVKLYAWEESLAKVIFQIRERELQVIRTQSILKAINMSLLFFWPVLVTAATFIVYSLDGGVVNTQNVFVVLAFLNVLRFPVILIPYGIATIAEGYVSAKRLDRFLKLEEIDFTHRTVTSTKDGAEAFLKIEDGEFHWTKPGSARPAPSGAGAAATSAALAKDGKPAGAAASTAVVPAVPAGPPKAEPPTLSNINVHIKAGELVAVIGHVGVGKSSLFASLLGEMHCSRGHVSVQGSIAYMSQENWIRNTTLRNNILFGLPYDEEKYNHVLDAAALRADIAILADGDSTEIGERGVTLSGGQKARVSLARAVYRAELSDIYLLDDPLSAVDMNVGRQMMYNCILGILKQKTRVVVLNSHLHFLPLFDRIIVVNNNNPTRSGYIEAVGPYSEIAKTHASLMRAEEGAADGSAEADEKHEGDKHRAKEEVLAADKKAKAAAAKLNGAAAPVEEKKETKRLIGDEDRVIGAVEGNVYTTYFDKASAGHGVLLLIGLMLVQCTGQVARVFSDYWLTWWAEDEDEGDPRYSLDYWYVSYSILVVITLVTLVGRGVVFALSSIASSRQLHADLFANLLRAPTPTFFDVTPVGRIINRFSKDLDAVDLFLPDFTGQFIINALQIGSVLVLAVIASPWFLLILGPILVMFWYVQQYFRISSREIKRLEGITRSPVYSSFGETLSGTMTIRAYGMAREFERNNRKLVDLNAKAFFMSNTSERWLAIRLDYLAATLVLTVALLFTGLRDTVNPSLAGLAIIYSLQLMGFLQYTVRLSVMAENAFTSVERLLHYTHIPSEKPYRIPEKKPPAEWPTVGQISINNITLRYRDDLPDVLKDINVQLRPREKVGVCGRTGSGKSSLMVALFRLVEARTGSITIDGVDIGAIGLGDLRSKLSIIPQDPVLFSGPLRFNLDPFNVHDDAKIMDVLERVHLAPFIRSLPTGLQHPVVEYGENFSHGQRQLVCIARALLRESRILVMDEATAAVDSETDKAIQETLRINFKDCTVLTIAHRLETIRDCDRILVLDMGRVAEFDTPDNLLNNRNGVFAKMVDQAGEQAAAKFRRGTAGGIAAAAATAAAAAIAAENVANAPPPAASA